MRRLLAILAVVMASGVAWSAPSVRDTRGGADNTQYRVDFDDTTADSIPMEVFGLCSIRFTLGSGDSGTATVYECDGSNDPTSSCTSETSFTASTATPYTFTPGQRWVKVAASATTLDDSKMTIDCTRNQLSKSEVERFNVTNYGTVGDGTTDDSAAFNRASAAAADAGGGIIYIPEGDYCLGEQSATPTGDARVYSGLRITSSNTYVQGDGEGRTILRPCGNTGNYVVTFCENATNTTCSSAGSTLTDVGISGVTIVDEDTLGDSGHSAYASMEQTDLAGGTPARSDSVTWNSGTESGTVAFYDASSGRIGIVEDGTDTLAASDVVTDGTWSATADSVEQNTTEESHGIIFRKVTRGFVDRVTFDRISDESIDIYESTDINITRSHGIDCGREEAGGSCISVNAGTTNVSVSGGSWEGGTDSISNSGTIIVMSANDSSGNTPVAGLKLSNTRIFDEDTGADLIEAAIAANANQGDITGILIDNVEIELDADGLDAITTSGGSFTSEIAVNNSRIIGAINVLDTHTASFTNVIATNENETSVAYAGMDTVTGGSWDASANATTLIRVTSNGASITGAKLSGSAGDCIAIAGDGCTVTGVVCTDGCGGGGGDHCVAEESGADLNTVSGNTYLNNNAGTSFLVGDGTITAGNGCQTAVGRGAASICDLNTVQN